MPWKIEDVDKHKQGLSDEQKKKWCSIANAALADCEANGGEDCDAMAIRIANSKFESKSNIKAVGDWEIEVLAAPFGGPDNRDLEGEYFTPNTQFHLDSVRPEVYYFHGYDPDGNPQGRPEVVGQTISSSVKDDGVWLRVLLDKASSFAQRIWEAAKNGLARASSGSASHLVRYNDDGEIVNWPMYEISLFDMDEWRQPCNPYAVALPVLKAHYAQSGSDLPEFDEDAAIGEKQSADNHKEDKNEKLGDNVKKLIGVIKMDEKPNEGMSKEDIAKIVAETVKTSIKAESEAAKVARDAELARAKEIEDAKKAAYDEGKKSIVDEIAKSGRLPNAEIPAVMKFNDGKFDGLDVGDHALLVGVLDSAKKANRSTGPSETAIKSLAGKMEGDKSEAAVVGNRALKARGIKANEVDYSTYSSYGDEWVGVAYSTSLWENIRLGAPVVQALAPYSVEVPQGMESIYFPLESTDPVFYKVAQATSVDGTLKVPAATVSNSPIGTDRAQLTLAKLGARTVWTGEMEEDSLIPFLPQLRLQLERAGAEYLESAIIDGDTETATDTNINDIDATPASTDWFLLFNGFRKSPLITTTSNSRDAGSLTVDDYIDTARLMGVAGKNALDRSKVSFIIDLNTHWASLKLSEVQSRDVFSQPTIEGGKLTGLWGYPIIVSGNMHKAATASLMANTAGKIDRSTVGNNTKGAILAVRWDQWKFGWKRRMTIEITRIANADSNEIVAMMRCGLLQRDTQASAISYNVTV
jgi:hypothetical protein